MPCVQALRRLSRTTTLARLGASTSVHRLFTDCLLIVVPARDRRLSQAPHYLQMTQSRHLIERGRGNAPSRKSGAVRRCAVGGRRL